MKSRLNFKRVRSLAENSAQGPVLYWMSRDQRVRDNWALLFAQDLALERKVPLVVSFCLVPSFLKAPLRAYDFMLDGLKLVEQDLKKHAVPFFLLSGSPEKQVVELVKKLGAGVLVTDFSPLRISREWKKSVARKIACPFYEVDAHNIIPCWAASPGQEFGAYTLRPKIRKQLSEFLEEFPPLRKHPFAWSGNIPANDWENARKTLRAAPDPAGPCGLPAGETAARKALGDFIKNRLARYEQTRNDPGRQGQSGLSPYLHFGQLSAQRVAREVRQSGAGRKSKEAFLEELIVRRELAENFCFYNPHYDSFEGFPAWARKTLNEHRRDKRDYLYTPEQFETARTHDEAWNAAQNEMVRTGKMHGYMRMYWAKKILEWTPSPEEALRIAVDLNDRYELDGRDPNGYAGIAWSLGGVHDRPWPERKIFGKIRFMNAEGLRRKFDMSAYLQKFPAKRWGF